MKTINIDKKYKTPSSGAFLSSVKTLSKCCKISSLKATNYLQGEDSYTRRKPRRTKFRRRRVMVPGIDHLWQADICFLPRYTSSNNGFSFLVTVIDVFSKYAFAVPMKSKKSKEVIRAFTSIFDSTSRRPKCLECDQGTEFWCKAFVNWIASHGVKMYHNYSDFGACVVERFNRTICTKISKYLTLTGQKTYINILPAIVKSYNSSVHSRTNMSPDKINKYNEMDV